MNDVLGKALARKFTLSNLNKNQKQLGKIDDNTGDDVEGLHENADGIMEDEHLIYGTKCNPPAFPYVLMKMLPHKPPPQLPDDIVQLPPGCPKRKITIVP